VSKPPILAVDVDGVISLFGFDAPPPPATASWHLIDGTPHCISLAAGERLRRLAAFYELAWATGWQDRANDHLPLVIGVGPLPVIEFDLPPTADVEPAADVEPVSEESLVMDPQAGRAEGGGESSRAGPLAGHWKLNAIDRFAGDRAIAWIDDALDESCFGWAADREARGLPTLLVPTEPELGVEEGHVAVLETWAVEVTAVT
jgi:hypothetical protein